MNCDTTQICRLCLESSDDSVYVFDKFQDSTIASVLTKHFWFQVDKNDGMSEWLCQICWIQVTTFHHFYKRIEFRHGTPRQSFKVVSVDAIKRERCDSPEVLMTNLCTIKFEETELTIDSETCEEGNRVDYSGDQSIKSEASGENLLRISNDDEQIASEEKSKTYNYADNQTLPPRAKVKFYKELTPSEQEEENAQIRQFFNMKCDLCDDVEFGTLPEAKKHYRIVHKMRGYLMCCRRKFWRRYLILEHIHHHINPDAFRCEPCGKSFYNEEILKGHMENHLPVELRPHRCTLCEKSYTKAQTLKFHMQNKHSNEQFPCDQCDKVCHSKNLLAYHTRRVHARSEEQCVCEICARIFKSKNSLRSHTICEHTTRPKAQCNICKVLLKHEAGLRHHMKRVHQKNVRDQSVNCSICNKLVKSKSALSSHMVTAHRGRCHKCSFCDKAFKRPQMLKEHIATHTGDQYLYDCPYCDKKFNSNANMYSHRKKTHLAEWTRDSQKRAALQNT